MADHSKPLITSTYANFVSELDGRFDDLTLGLDPAVTSPTNLPTGAIRWNSASYKWEKWSGSSWADLSPYYNINLSGPLTLTANSSSDALRITQTGAGNALVVEDSANPDSSPFVITGAGDVGIGAPSPTYKLHVNGKSVFTDTLTVGNQSTGAGVMDTIAYQFSESRGWGYNPDDNRIFFNSSGGIIPFWTQSGAAYFDGNLGLGVTPSAWGSGFRALDGYAGFAISGGTQLEQLSNAYYNGTSWTYKNSTLATRYSQISGTHSWYTAPSGTAGNTISFTQAMTLDASGALGVGTSGGSGGSLTVQNNTSGQATIAIHGSNVNPVASTRLGVFGFGTAASTLRARIVGFTDGNWTDGSSTPSNLTFWTTPSGSTTVVERMRIDSAGDVTLQGNISVGGATPTTSGTGITFPATQAASTNANTLDDYEEGTFTPAVAGTTSAGTGTYSTQIGTYTKIGRTVFFKLYVNWSAHTGTGNIQINGLPFTSSSGGGTHSAVTVAYPANLALTANNVLHSYINTNTTIITIGQYPVGGGASTSVAMDTAANLILSGFYDI